MWNFVTQLAPASTGVDFTQAFSPLLVGLVSVTWVATGMLTAIALQHFRTQRSEPIAETLPTPADDRAAA